MNENGPRQLTPLVSQHDHTLGPANAPVTLVEYGDYECPYCSDAYKILKQVRQQMGNRLRYVFRNFPLSDIHPYAEQAAEAAEAAGAQGKFWQMHDMLYEHQDALDEMHLKQYANRLGLDMQAFDQALANHTFAGRVREDYIGGVQNGVHGTPTFFINGRHYNGPWDAETLLSVLERVAGK